MTSIADFVGLPFADHGRDGGFDCWGGVRAVLSACVGVHLPDYGDGYEDCGDHDGIASAIRDGLAADFVPVSDPRAFDLVIFRVAGQPHHVGVMVGPASFLHWPEPSTQPNGVVTGGTSRIERIDDRMWHKRIEGFYRYAG